MSANQASTVHRFGVYEFDPRRGELRKQGMRIRFEGQPVAILTMLLKRPGEVVPREELQKELWPADTFVDFEHSLNAAIKRLRAVLNDSADAPRYIETLPGRGYRLIAPVQGVSGSDKAAASVEAEPRGVSEAPARTRHRPIRIALVVAGLLVAGLAAWGWREWRHGIASQRPVPAIRSLAVLPLQNLTSDASEEYFADGMTDELITDLAQIHSLRVISRTSVMQFKQTKKKLPEIAAELNVDAVVEGSVVRSGPTVRVTAQLLDARQDRHLWASSYERQVADIVGLQGEVAKAIADQVRAKLTPEEDAILAKRRPTNPEAYDALLKGRFFLHRRNAAAEEKALGHLRRAVEIDPGYAEAWSELAACYASMGADVGVADRAKVLPEAHAAIAKALAIDGDLPEAHVTLAWIKLWYDWDWSGAEREFRRGIELNPNDSAAHRFYSQYLQVRKRFDEALEENKRAIDLAPLDILASVHLAWLYVDARQSEKAIEQSQKVLEMDPTFVGSWLFVAAAYEQQGKWPEAIAAWEKTKDMYGGTYLAGVAYASAMSGNRRQAEDARAKLIELSKHRYVSPLAFAQIDAALGDREAAFRRLERAYEERATGLIELGVGYRFDTLRSDPRFQELERRIGL
jgi:TolB-like protein/DNA-binding winged helix-turn-helix (wHTH) protein/Tfp pilus assembly protein PilF